jgi:hypothetical protein
MKTNGPLPILIAAAVTVAMLCTLIVPNGWAVWIPILAGLAVLGFVSSKFGY